MKEVIVAMELALDDKTLQKVATGDYIPMFIWNGYFKIDNCFTYPTMFQVTG